MVGDDPIPAQAAGGPNGDIAEIRAHQRAWEAFAGCAVRLIPVLKAQMVSVTGETERSALELLAHLRILASSQDGASEGERAVSLSKVVMAMQFQDITRQKLEHVSQALDQWSVHLQALMRGPRDEAAKREIAAALSPDYQEPVPVDSEKSETETDSITLF